MGFERNGRAYVLNSATQLPMASGFLWNRHMLLQANCRGYVNAQFMQGQSRKYSIGPALEAQTFMQPEQPYYTHYPGRFFYLKNTSSGKLGSIPYEPVRQSCASFRFICQPASISWQIQYDELEIELRLCLQNDSPIELWELSLTNTTLNEVHYQLSPYFSVGYRSWMNQSANFISDIQAIACHAVTPYQKVEDYWRNKDLHDVTYLISETRPDSWQTRQQAFEGEGGLHNPDALHSLHLENRPCHYETPAAIMQFAVSLHPNQTRRYRFAFGPAKDEQHIRAIQHGLFAQQSAAKSFATARKNAQKHIQAGKGVITVHSGDTDLDNFINTWLPRQVYYHGDINRLTTDPQTRNYLQDNMGMAYIQPDKTRQALLLALRQQSISGEMPDGVLLNEHASLNYINQIPHSDHCVWLPICLQGYLNETADVAILDHTLAFADSDINQTVFEHLEKAMGWLLAARDERGLSLINQGDWCDPMNMVGYQGKGVSAWLTMASSYAFLVWADICERANCPQTAQYWQQQSVKLNERINHYFWAQHWYARGMTDHGRLFGIECDPEGKIFLNPQSWAMLCKAISADASEKLIEHIQSYLDTPFGTMLLAPSFTGMVEDIGRVTQKFPGTAENGSVYNHGVVFYIYALYHMGQSDLAYQLLVKMLPSAEDMHQRGQLPIFLPNYYRGAYHQYPLEAGRSSQLFNTGTAAWYYRVLIECTLGLKGCEEGLLVEPNLPGHWQQASVVRYFRGKQYNVRYWRDESRVNIAVVVDSKPLDKNLIICSLGQQIVDVDVYIPG